MSFVRILARSAGSAWLMIATCPVVLVLFHVTGGDEADYIYLSAIFVAIGATLIGLSHNQPSGHRWPWLALVGSELSFFVAVLASDDDDDDKTAGLTTAVLIDNAAQIVGFVLIAVALSALIRQRRSDKDDPGRADALVVVFAAALLAWVTLVEPMWRQAGENTFVVITSAVKPAFDVVVIAASAQLVLMSRRRTPALWMLGLALAAVFACDLLDTVFELTASASYQYAMDALTLFGFFGIAAASLHPSSRQLSRPETVVLRRLGVVRTMWLTAVLLLPVTTTAIWLPHPPQSSYGRLVLSLLLTLTVVGRLVRNTNARIQREQHANRRAAHDELTGLPNRARFYEELGQATGDPDRSFALLMIDLNDFKKVNDAHGHRAGDAVLVAFGDILNRNTRSADIVARLGGDEFAVLLDVHTAAEAAAAAHRIGDAAALHRVPVGDQATTTISCSIGIALIEPVAKGRPETTELLHRADLAMYAAKRIGRSGWRFFAEGEAAPEDSASRSGIAAPVHEFADE